MSRSAYRLDVSGIVQGVGFRPFIYRLAKRFSLNGYVSNTMKGAMVYVEGERETIREFIDSISEEKPGISTIERIEIIEVKPVGTDKFSIEKSISGQDNEIFISADLSICDDCRRDILNPDNRRYKYPFTTCTYCGPRYSIVVNIPYDRVNTVMNEFAMCDECQEEYDNPLDRRFHSQPNACHICGPQLSVYNTCTQEFEDVLSPIDFTAERLKDGKIIAIKGLGGYLLCCDATNNNTVKLLRKRKFREAKPFAVMCRGLDTVKGYCYVSDCEEKLILRPENPIVLLKKRQNEGLAHEISMDNNYLGIMLPYTPLHVLLMEHFEVLVMTSANVSDIPIIIEDSEAKGKLSGIADYVLAHNRKIQNRVDDSVYKVVNDSPQAIRRARGFVPGILKSAKLNKTILAVGAELKNTFAINRGQNVFIGPHIGDLKNVETFEFFKESIAEFQRIFNLAPEVVACDKHPEYVSTGFAKENYPDIPIVEIQHHHAHLVSALAEKGLSGPAIGISMDGTGFGLDGAIWGCESGIVSTREFLRKGHLDYFYLPGGDKCAEEVYRCAFSLLYSLFGKVDAGKYSFLNSVPQENMEILTQMLEKKVNVFSASSMGRFFDGVSSLLGLGNFSRYEAGAAIILEKIADESISEFYEVDIRNNNGIYIWDWRPVIFEIVNDMLKGGLPSTISARFHNSVVRYILKMADILSNETGLFDVVLSGGVFYNSWISSKAEKILSDKGYKVHLQRIFPAGDGGISLGQIIIANEVI